MDGEILAEYRRLIGELKRNREALGGLLDRVKQADGSLKLTEEAEGTWDRLDKEYRRDRRALRKLLAAKGAKKTSEKAAAKAPGPSKPAAS